VHTEQAGPATARPRSGRPPSARAWPTDAASA
jgi:hypothetical protein